MKEHPCLKSRKLQVRYEYLMSCLSEKNYCEYLLQFGLAVMSIGHWLQNHWHNWVIKAQFFFLNMHDMFAHV